MTGLPPMPDKGGPEMFIKGISKAHIMVRKNAFEVLADFLSKSYQAVLTDDLIGEFFGVWTFDMPRRNQEPRFDLKQQNKGVNTREAKHLLRRFYHKAKRATGM